MGEKNPGGFVRSGNAPLQQQPSDRTSGENSDIRPDQAVEETASDGKDDGIDKALRGQRHRGGGYAW